MTTATASSETFQGYRAEQAADGTWTIYDVPVFSAHTDERGQEPIEFSAKWLDDALSRAQVREREGYLPPLHVDHHPDDGVEAAGKYRLTRRGSISHGGERVETLFADLIGVRPAIYQRIRRGELSYRSVEILDISEAELDSLALLDHEVPYFRYPLLKIAEEKPLEAQVRLARSQRSPVLAFTATGHRRSVLLRFQEASMTPTDPQKKPGESDAPEEKKGGEEPMPVWAQMMVKALGAICTKLGVASDGASAAAPTPAEPPKMSATGGAPSVGVDGAYQASAARSEGKQDAMAEQFKAMQKRLDDLELERKVEARCYQLKAAGRGEDVIAKFKAKAAKDGLQVALEYAAAAEEFAPAEPPARFSGDLSPSRDPDPPELAAYAAEGPEMLERARDLARSHRKTRSTVPLKEFIALNLDPSLAFQAPARK